MCDWTFLNTNRKYFFRNNLSWLLQYIHIPFFNFFIDRLRVHQEIIIIIEWQSLLMKKVKYFWNIIIFFILFLNFWLLTQRIIIKLRKKFNLKQHTTLTPSCYAAAKRRWCRPFIFIIIWMNLISWLLLLQVYYVKLVGRFP